MRDPDALIARAGVRGDPDRDQHFLVDDRVLDRLPTYLEDLEVDTSHLLEIGGGTGALTDRLLAIADEVTVIERDRTLAAFLEEEFRDEIEAGQLTVIEGDALEADLPDFTASVSNLPYGVSSEITFRLLPEGRPLVLMFQQEFAERMVAESGTSEYGRLSVSTQHYADVELVESIPKEAFSPAPAVQSAVIRAVPRKPDYEVDDEEFFLRFVKALFTQRRKTIRNAIRNTAHISNLEEPEAVVEAADDDILQKRADAMAPAEFAALAQLALEVGEPTT
ncbi:16S ribosomal RNA methyltransferase A [Natronolimnobius sp. AArcel1]|uniref:16S ribosomal RNA methyltransferase A n=1 Tax=Natronolimnobius sp. AArcel1 TaxID=1679093 RepID=UPI0013EB27EC|nr:16S ribosomal RNA methyltransferase A [Natronolimnobius sp. AArcel1]NGM69651.1 16S ribosomal RNA methyltransferase A [Natronolimnobius sp. AArcel1]